MRSFPREFYLSIGGRRREGSGRELTIAPPATGETVADGRSVSENYVGLEVTAPQDPVPGLLSLRRGERKSEPERESCAYWR